MQERNKLLGTLFQVNGGMTLNGYCVGSRVHELALQKRERKQKSQPVIGVQTEWLLVQENHEKTADSERLFCHSLYKTIHTAHIRHCPLNLGSFIFIYCSLMSSFLYSFRFFFLGNTILKNSRKFGNRKKCFKESPLFFERKAGREPKE